MNAKYGVFCGDARSRYLADALRSRGAGVATWNVNEAENTVDSLPELVRNSDILIGPMPFSKYMIVDEDAPPEHEETVKKQKINELFSAEELLRNLSAGQYLFAGKLPEQIRQRLRQQQIICFDFYEDKEVQKRNAVLTAEGCLLECIRERQCQLKGTRVLVCGYGCCGKELARAFAGLGAKVTVGIRRTASAWQAVCEGYSVCYTDSLQNAIPKQDIVINTVPKQIFFEETLHQFSRNTLLVEIASAPGGFDTVQASKMGIWYMVCPGLPGRYFPRGAADILVDCIEKRI